MLGIPTFFYDCYSQRTLDYLQEANHCISEISEILPEHTIIQEFRDMFFRSNSISRVFKKDYFLQNNSSNIIFTFFK